jgi:hypothetical protein
MSDIIGSYAFLPWLRQGVARIVTSADGDASVLTRATARVDLTLTGTGLENPTPAPVGRDVELYGPGEVIGIESRAIVRVEPRPWITNVEPNYLAHIEFYEEDFPWRYTPAAADASRLKLRPWIALVVLKDTGDPATAEFREAKAVADRPLQFVSVKDFAAFPPAADLWAWAHVHVNKHLGGTTDELVATDVPAAVGRLQDALALNPDIAYSRIVCPRRLEENCAYHAFLVPSFERGRLAGLGMDPNLAPFASASAWVEYGGRPEPLNMPYYYRWYFRTGGAGDFESLVKLLKWKTADPRVGRRDMDVQAPGSNKPGITDPHLHGILRLGGALRAPLITLSPSGLAEYQKYENWAKAVYPHPFQQKLARFINLADSYTRTSAEQARIDAGMPPTEPDDVDPLITSPIYGEWQALQHRLLTDPDGNPLNPNDNWIHELNLDPRHRVAAGFGGDVVRKHQEDYMEAAWQQVGEVLAHNRKARIAQTWVQVTEAAYLKSVSPLVAQPSRVLALTAPLQARVLDAGTTIRFARQQSLTPAVLTSPTMRRISRPQGPLARRLALKDGPHANRMLEAVNEGAITAAPPKETPGGIATVEQVAAASADARTWPPQWLIDLARNAPWLRWVLALVALALVVLAFVLPALAVLFGIGAVVAIVAAAALELARRQPTVAEALGEQLDTPAAVDQLGPGPNFVFGEDPGSGGDAPGGIFASDNVAATRFKAALRDWAIFATEAEIAGRQPPRIKLDLNRTAGTVVEAVRPAMTIPKRFLASAVLAPHIRVQIFEVFDEIKYYPRIDEPMYRPLKDMSKDKFVPNLDLVERDSVVALETYQEFIEAYMVGVNHEFSRELLWREYPTDMRGSYFRQFWDVTAHFDPNAADADAQREKLYDIPPIHMWSRFSELGEHDNRQPDPGQERNEIVLVIRGELLKKYPNTVVYAHAAQWAKDQNGNLDPTQERELVPLEGGEADKPPRTKVRTPLYEAKVDPDIYFFGFDLDADEARGGTGEPTPTNAGWFFVLKERPGEPRFGLDVSRPAAEPIVTVNDLTWADANVQPGKHLNPGVLGSISLTAPSPARGDMEKKPQHDDDVKVVPASISAARWAYLLYQSPVMVAVHAAELLKTATE